MHKMSTATAAVSSGINKAGTLSDAASTVSPQQCSECQMPLSQQRYILHDNRPFCIPCYEAKFSNTCHVCGKLIATDSRDVGFKGNHWHDRCFRCCQCSEDLIDKPFACQHDDQLLCAACYEKNPTLCAECNKPFHLGSKKFVYQHKQWHETCFNCIECNAHIGTNPFIPYNDQPVCTTCYENMHALKCDKCKQVIDKGGLKYKGVPFHKECFQCVHCSRPLVDELFAVRDYKPYCVDCYGELYAKKCASCSKPITGIEPEGTKFVSFEGQHWHTSCFVCQTCEKNMVGQGFVAIGVNMLPVCVDCNPSGAKRGKLLN